MFDHNFVSFVVIVLILAGLIVFRRSRGGGRSGAAEAEVAGTTINQPTGTATTRVAGTTTIQVAGTTITGQQLRRRR